MYMSRADLMLDEDLLPLKEPLERRNFLVGTVPFNTPARQMSALLAHRLFITNNTDHFLKAVVAHKFSLIDNTDASRSQRYWPTSFPRHGWQNRRRCDNALWPGSARTAR